MGPTKSRLHMARLASAAEESSGNCILGLIRGRRVQEAACSWTPRIQRQFESSNPASDNAARFPFVHSRNANGREAKNEAVP
jgi:hypothetical protein